MLLRRDRQYGVDQEPEPRPAGGCRIGLLNDHQKAASGRSMIARSVASAISRSAASLGSTVRANQRAEATLPS